MQASYSPGEVFEKRFKILSRLGSGGMGSVYLAEQLDAQRLLALKIIHFDENSLEEDEERFLRECKLLSRLQHQNIVTFYGAALSEEGQMYSLCEYVEGVTLRQLLGQQLSLPWSRLANIVRQICAGLAYAHAQGVVHRDLKPENIILTDKPEPDTVKIIDFGLARALAEGQDQKLTATGMIVGTPNYMSPEQVMGERAGPASDVYALACIMFECLTGKKLFDAANPLEIIDLQVSSNPRPALKAVLGESNGQLLELLSLMLEKKVKDRLGSMQELAAALEALSVGRLANPDEKPAAFSRHSLFIILFLTSIVLLSAAATVYFLIRASQDKALTGRYQLKTSGVLSRHEDGIKAEMKRFQRKLASIKSDEERKKFLWNFIDHYVDYADELKVAGKSARDIETAVYAFMQETCRMAGASIAYEVYDHTAYQLTKLAQAELAEKIASEGLDLLLKQSNSKLDLSATNILCTKASAQLKQHKMPAAAKSIALLNQISRQEKSTFNKKVALRVNAPCFRVLQDFYAIVPANDQEKIDSIELVHNLLENMFLSGKLDDCPVLLDKAHKLISGIGPGQKGLSEARKILEKDAAYFARQAKTGS